MKDYLSDFKNGSMAQIVPAGLCPLFYHTLIPYIITIMDGGWFSWVRKTKDASYRKAIDPRDFDRSVVDRLYPNEVLVQCPNINAALVAGVGPHIGPSGQRGILLRVLDKKGECVNKHEIGTQIVLNKNDFKIPPLRYNALFPSLLVRLFAGSGPLSDRALDESSRTIRVEGIENRCRYHKTKCAYEKSLLPGNFCMEAFHRIYPQALALLYSPRKKVNDRRSFEHSCPDCSGTVSIKTEIMPRFPSKLVFLRKILEKLFAVIFFPYDFIDHNIIFTVKKSASAPGCRLDEKMEYRFNMLDKRYPCPSSLHALYPYMLLAANNIRLPWPDEGYLFHCPGCKGVVYGIGEKGGGN